MHDDSISLGGFATLTNIGAAYDTIQASRGLGIALVNFTGVESIDFRVGVNKIGTGTQSWQLWNQTDAAEIGVIDDAGAASEKFLSTTINGGAIPTGIKLVRVRAKSTVAADDPVFGGATLLLRRPAITFERLGLAEQIIRNAFQLTHNMRSNANAYKAQVTAGVIPIATIAQTMVADAGQYLIRLAWFTSLAAADLPLLTQVLGDYNLTLSNLASFRDNLITVAEHTEEATLTTGQQINTEADFVLANVPNFRSLWPQG
jgi:hypothetical protein